MPAGPVVVGRDARPTGPMVLRAALAGLTAAGREVVDVGLATTPATQIAWSTSARPVSDPDSEPQSGGWNALKFLSHRGEFVDAAVGARVRARFEANRECGCHGPGRRGTGGRRRARVASRAGIGLEFIDVSAIRARRLKVAVDGCAVSEVSRCRGCCVSWVPRSSSTTAFQSHLPRARAAAEHLERSAPWWQPRRDFGIAVDPDADRAAFVDARGVPSEGEPSRSAGRDPAAAARSVVTNCRPRSCSTRCARATVFGFTALRG